MWGITAIAASSFGVIVQPHDDLLLCYLNSGIASGQTPTAANFPALVQSSSNDTTYQQRTH